MLLFCNCPKSLPRFFDLMRSPLLRREKKIICPVIILKTIKRSSRDNQSTCRVQPSGRGGGGSADTSPAVCVRCWLTTSAMQVSCRSLRPAENNLYEQTALSQRLIKRTIAADRHLEQLGNQIRARDLGVFYTMEPELPDTTSYGGNFGFLCP